MDVTYGTYVKNAMYFPDIQFESDTRSVLFLVSIST